MNEQLSPSVNEGKQDINNSFLITHESNEELETVDLNFVIKDVFTQQRKRLEALKVISRYDVLPTVKGNADAIKALFNNLVSIILDNPPVKNKLFLYIKCETKLTDVIDLTLPLGYQIYQISFHANTEVCSIESFKNCWEDCEEKINTLPHSFVSLSKTNTGCLFYITIPGKLN